MRPKTLLQVLTVGGLALAAVGPAYAQPAKCQTVQFSQAVLDKFPRVRELCLDVITRDGQEYAVVKGDLLRVSRTTARIRPILPDGSKAEPRNIAIDPARKVMVAGKAVSPVDIAVGQELSFYVKVSEPVAALEPADTAPLAPMPLPEPAAEPAPAAAPEMPKTASPLPLIGLGGLALLALGGGLGLARRRKI
jgi:LPXTG-motif cell wall-anchored protein